MITFSASILQSPEAQTLDFLEKDKTPQSYLPKDSEPEASLAAGQGQPTKQSWSLFFFFWKNDYWGVFLKVKLNEIFSYFPLS